MTAQHGVQVLDGNNSSAKLAKAAIIYIIWLLWESVSYIAHTQMAP
jgi:hypothetical protein